MVKFTLQLLYPRGRGAPGGWMGPKASIAVLEKETSFILRGIELRYPNGPPFSLIIILPDFNHATGRELSTRYTESHLPRVCVVIHRIPRAR